MGLAWRDSSYVTRCQDPLLVGRTSFHLHRAFDTENSVRYFAVVVPRHTLAWPHGQNRCPEILDFGNNLATFDFVAPAHEPSTLMYFLNMMRLRVEFSSPHITSIEHRKNPTNFVCCCPTTQASTHQRIALLVLFKASNARKEYFARA